MNFKFSVKKGTGIETIEEMSGSRNEPDWLREFRLRSYDIFVNKSVSNSVCDSIEMDLQNIHHHNTASIKEDKRLDNDKSAIDIDGHRSPTIPQTEHTSVTETNIQHHFDAICHNLREYLTEKGVIVVDMDTAVKEHTELLEKHLGMIIPPEDNRNAALNGALWSSGLFIYFPPNVKIDFPIYSNYRNNDTTTNQFERNLIIADEGAEVHYIEGCISPTQTHVEGSLHSLVTELVANKYSKIR